MKKYRDFCVAHLDLKRRVDVKNFPDLELALTSTTFYYQHVIGLLRGMGFSRYPDDLKVYYDDLLKQTTDIAQAASAATKGFDERAN